MSSRRAWLDMLANSLLGVSRELAIEAAAGNAVTVPVEVVPPFSVVDLPDWIRSVQLWNRHGRPLLADQPARGCPSCSGSRHHPLFDSVDGYPYHECDKCGSWFVPKRVDYELFHRYLAGCPEARELEARIVKARLMTDRAESDRRRIGGNLQWLQPFLDANPSRSRTYLDVGCGLGYSLEAAESMGFVARGVEVEPFSVEDCRRRGLRVENSANAHGSRGFAVVSLFETIEHLDDPFAVLSESIEALAPDGLLMLTFPNLNCPTVRLLRGECSWLYGGSYTPGHINLFSAESIAALLKRCGLSLLRAEGQYGMDRRELLLFATGRYGGVSDLIHGRVREPRMSEFAMEFDHATGPPVTLLERVLLLSPIVRLVACRSASVGRYRDVAANIAAQRATAIEGEANGMLPPRGSRVELEPVFGARIGSFSGNVIHHLVLGRPGAQ